MKHIGRSHQKADMGTGGQSKPLINFENSNHSWFDIGISDKIRLKAVPLGDIGAIQVFLGRGVLVIGIQIAHPKISEFVRFRAGSSKCFA